MQDLSSPLYAAVPLPIIVLYLDILEHVTDEHKRARGRRKTYIV